MIKKVFAVSIIAATVALAGCSSDDDDSGGTTTPMTPDTMGPDTMEPDNMEPANPGNGNNVADALSNDMGETAEDGTITSRFDTLLVAAATAGLDASLGNVNNNFIVFAPVDSAFPADTTALLADVPALTNTLSYHVVSIDTAPAADFALEVGTLTAMAGGTVEVAAGADVDAPLTVNGNPVGDAIIAENGVIYPIEVLLEPMTLAPDGGDMTGGDMTPAGDVGVIETAFSGAAGVSVAYEAFIAAGQGGSLDGQGTDADGNMFDNTWTVFAPSDASLAAATPPLTAADLTSEVLLRHIVTSASIPATELATLATVTNQPGTAYDVVTDADGNITVGGFAVTEISTGQSTVYQIEGVLP